MQPLGLCPMFPLVPMLPSLCHSLMLSQSSRPESPHPSSCQGSLLCRLSSAPLTSAILVCVLPAAAPVPSCCGCCPVPWGQEGLIPFPVSLMVAHGGCGCPAGHGAGHSGTGGCNPAGTSWHRERAGVGVSRCPVPLGLSLPPGRGRARCPQPCRSLPVPAVPPGMPAPPGGRAGSGPELGAGSVPVPERGAQGGAGAGAAARGGDGPCRSRCAGRGCAGVAAPVPVRGVELCCAGAGPRGGDELCRSWGVGRRRAVPVPLSGAVPVPVPPSGAAPVPVPVRRAL